MNAQDNRCRCSTVVLVEDEHDIRDAVREVLEEEGYSVRLAANGREALRELSDAPSPCLVLLDLMMPEMNGWQLLEALKHNERLARIPVVLVSASDTMPSGTAGIIRKPFDIDTLLFAVDRHCRERAGDQPPQTTA